MTKTYSEKLLSPKWQQKRLRILERDQFTCKKCGDKESTLHIHHIKYDGHKDPWLYEDSELDCLCCDCHFVVSDIEKYKGFDYHKFLFFKSKHGSNLIYFIKDADGVFFIIKYENKNRELVTGIKDPDGLSNFLIG